MADYSFTPQFANLSGLQPLPALDVTRGAALQFQPLQAIQIQSSRPELVAQGIAGAVSSIAQGALSGITAKYEKEEEKEKEKRKYAHELMLYGAKDKSDNADFYAKEEARFISENSGKPGFAKKYDEFKKAYSGFSDRVPETKVDKEPSDDEIVEEPLPEQQPELKANFETPSGDIPEDRPGVFSLKPSPRVPQEKPLEAIPVSTTAAPAAPALEGLPAPERRPQVVTTQEKPKVITEVDYTEYPEPATYDTIPTKTGVKKIETDAEAQNLASILNNQLKGKNLDYEYRVLGLGDPEKFKTVAPVKIRDERIKKEQSIISQSREQRKEVREEAKAEREAKESEQQMQIRQQKVKDENKALADHVETAATSLRELDDIISTIEKNPWSVGRMSALYSKMPIDTDAAKVRAKLETVGSTVAINALTSMRQASPTGAAVGNASDKDMAMFKATEGSFDPDNLKSEDILPVLREIKRKRQKIYNDASEVLKANNPEYNPPEIKYPKKEKVTQTEKVSVISPDGKVGKIPKPQLDEALSKGYKLQ